MRPFKTTYLSALTAFLVYGVSGQTAGDYGQCGGIGWTGATTCPANWTCSEINDYYSQCFPGTATTSTTTATTPTTVPSSTVGTGSTSASSTSTATTTASSGSATLAPGYSFVRAVEDPYFHQYLQSEVLNTPTTAVLGNYTNAAQFQVVNGQLIQNAAGTNLYATVDPPANSSVTMLGMTWSTTPDTLGTFVFSGDSLEWSSPTVPRPQTNAWLVCPSGTTLFIYINLGYYDYETPTGCSDETLNAYTGPTAVP
ncbi:carbohydrate-binding module family 1 protein [Mycena maculata]|uniref:Carbohydrate-binding module family 1 protein n=1 Tax=Mycena maculata TaxID=230809 RepID=A0AAD7JGY4_9AGAR|nr:carbohydrate-binding module family 1 protein [Mycena maculata]